MKRYLQVALLAAILFVPFLGAAHLFDWDEINFAECAREMIVTKDYLRMQIDYAPFYEKPPLFIWMQVLSMKMFGINEFAARFPNAVIGVLSFLMLFHVGKKVGGEKRGLWWVAVYAATWIPNFYFKSGIIDPTFNLFIFSAFYAVFRAQSGVRSAAWCAAAGVMLGLAVLTKGPVALIVSGIALLVFLVAKKGRLGFPWYYLLLTALLALALPSIWFGIEYVQNGPAFLKEFLSYQAGLFSQNIADHEEPWFYHPLVLFFGCFPASLFLFAYIRKKSSLSYNTSSAEKIFTFWMWIMFWVVLILFSIVKTKIVHYSSLCWFPLTYLAAREMQRIAETKTRLQTGVFVLLLFVGTVWGILLCALPLTGMHTEQIIPLIKDPFAVANLQAAVHWSTAEVAIGAGYLVLLLTIIVGLRRNFAKFCVYLFCLQVAAIHYTILNIAPKIEAYSQRAAIEFFEGFQGKDVYIQCLGYKSYAHLFYARKMPVRNKRYYEQDWLMNGQPDKLTYFVCKIQNADQYAQMPILHELYRKNGFVFFARKDNAFLNIKN